MSYVLGVDFGTSFTAAAVHSEGSTRTVTLGNRSGAIPSAAYIRADGTVAFGDDAYARSTVDPSRYIGDLKRRLGVIRPISVDGRRFDPSDLVAGFLGSVIDRIYEREGGEPDHVLFTHPATWRSMRVDRFRHVLDLAGLGGVELVTEPVAAAVYYASTHPVTDGTRLAVYDLGGGTFDVAVLRRRGNGFVVIGEPDGIDHLGGLEFDDTMLMLVRRQFPDRWHTIDDPQGGSSGLALATLARDCVEAKEVLSSELDVDLAVMLPGISAAARVTRDELESLVGPAIDETVQLLMRTISRSGAEMSDLDAVLLVGGSSQMPIVTRSILAALGKDVVVLRTEPKFAVARGAALLAAQHATTSTDNDESVCATNQTPARPASLTDRLSSWGHRRRRPT